MMQEDYVSFETAKLLKEKGFDWEESPFYCEQDRDEWRQANRYTVPNPHYNSELPFDTEALTIIAPHVSLQTAMKWLREVYNTHIEVKYFFETHIYKYTITYTPVALDNINSHPQCFNTYEQACEAAIKYCLENLI